MLFIIIIELKNSYHIVPWKSLSTYLFHAIY